MAANNRIFYACQRLGIAPLGSTAYTTVRGVQSVGMTTTFNLKQAFELGQVAIYENIEGIPDVEMSLEKVLDGYAPIYTLVTQDATSASLTGRSASRCSVALGIYSDTADSSTGNALSTVQLSGMYVSSVGYSFTVNDFAKETVSLVGNNRVWVAASAMTWTAEPFANNDDSPGSIAGSGGVQNREDVLFGADGTILPKELPGIAADGTNTYTGGVYSAHVQSLNTSVNLGREDLFELGRKGNYNRYVRFPISVTTAIGLTSVSGDMISATEDGLYSEGGDCGRYNLQDQEIILKLCEGLRVDLGTKNKLASVNVTGGEAGGGNQEITYNYQNFNDFAVFHPQDPNAGDVDFQPSGSVI